MEGQRIGSYRVVRKIGQGGMGAVYEAVHEQLGGLAAIKLLRKELSSDKLIKNRFLNEARAASRIDHPGVVKIFEFSDLPDGSTYIIMEFLRGEALSARLRGRGGRLAIPETIRTSRQIASALAAAHAIHIVHRDLKPDNVMLVPDPEMPGGERAKVLDFGIAKIVAGYSGPAAEEYRTNTGMVLGTATYMAPEQCKGAGDVTEKADVYSLGVMMYRMCCGQLPFRAEGQGEVMAMHIFSTAKPLREHDASIPEPLAELVARMMRKESTERPTMTEVAQELDKMTGGPSMASQPLVVAMTGPPADSSGVSSTLSAALGQSGRIKAVEEPPPRGRRLRLAVVATAAVIAVGFGVRFALPRLQTMALPKPGPVVWALSSNPPEAQVLNKADGKELCRTACQLLPEPGVGHKTLIFRAPGYLDKEVTLDETASYASPVTLEKAQAEAQPTPSVPPTAKPSEPATAPSPGHDAVSTTQDNSASSATPRSGAQATDQAKGPDSSATAPQDADPAGPRPPGSVPARGPIDPASGKVRPGKTPAPGTKRGQQGATGDSMLTDDKIRIIE